MAYISMKDYTKNINKKIVLDHVNLNIEQGGINALVGSNGSGKTMLIRELITTPLATKSRCLTTQTQCQKKASSKSVSTTSTTQWLPSPARMKKAIF